MQVSERIVDTRPAPAPAAARRPLLALLVFQALVIALVAQLSWQALRSSHEAYADRAEDAVDNIALGLSNAIGAEIGRIDTVMRATVIAVEREGGTQASREAIARVLEREGGLLSKAATLRVTGPGGDVGGGAADGNPQSVTDREFFRRVREASSDSLVVSEPVLEHVGGRWVLMLARRIDGPDGAFGGAMLAMLSTGYFDKLFEDIEIGPNGAIALRTTALRLVARRGGTPDGRTAEIGSDSVADEMRRAIAQSPQHGGVIARNALDGIERLNRYHQVGALPLVVIAGLATQDYLQPWWREALLVGVFDALLLVVLVVSSLLMWRAWMRSSASARQAERAAWRYRALMRTASDGIHVLDHTGRIVDLSESFATMLGFGRDSLIGMHVSSWDARYAPGQPDPGMLSFRTGQRAEFETKYRRSDGTPIDVEVTSVGVEIDAQELLYCSARDITQRRRAEQALIDLAREQALRAQAERHARELDALLRERSDMLDVLAHEVRQPLNNASAALQSAAVSMAQARDALAPQRVARAQNVLGHVMSSIDNTLAVASLLARPGPVDRVDTDIDMLVAMSIGDMPAEERARVRIDRQTRVRTAAMDMSLMRLALRNVLANALKYAPAGSVVTVRVCDADDPLELNIDVIDRGPGIVPEQLEGMFERGRRGLNAGSASGLGLGLYIVRRVMELHGGSVRAMPSADGFMVRLVIVEIPVEAGSTAVA